VLLALEHKWFIKCFEDAGLGLMKGEHHFHMHLQLFALDRSASGSFRRGSWRGEKEDVVVLQSQPWVLVHIEELMEDALHDPNFVNLTFNIHWLVGWVSIVIPFGDSRVVLDHLVQFEWPAGLLVLGVASKRNRHACWEIANHGLRNAVLKEDTIRGGAGHQKPANCIRVVVGLADFAIPRTVMVIKPGPGNAILVTGKEVGHFVAPEPQVDPVHGPT